MSPETSAAIVRPRAAVPRWMGASRREHEDGESVRLRRAEAADEVVRARAHLAVAGRQASRPMERRRSHPRRGGLVTRPVVADSGPRRDGAQERPELARGDAEQVVDPASDQRSRARGAAVEALDGSCRRSRPAVPPPSSAAAEDRGRASGTHGIVVPIRLPR